MILMENTKVYLCNKENIPKAVNFVNELLTRENIVSKERTATLLKLENALECVVRKSDQEKDEFSVRVVKLLFHFRIIVSFKGDEITVQEIVPDMGLDDLNEMTADILRSKLLPILSENIRAQYRYGTNRITVSVSRKKMNRIVRNMLCMLLGILAGLLFKTVLPKSISVFVANELLGTVITAFFNLLKMIVAPLVFFSIVSGISGFGDTRELGKISAKTIAYFVVFSIVGLLIGLGVFAIFPSGSTSIMELVSYDANKATMQVTAWQSFKDLVLSFFPSNLLGAFVNNEILAVIFLAILFGICTGRMRSEYVEPLTRASAMLNDLMCKLAELIVSVMPFIIFCSMAKTMITIEFSSAAVLLKLLLSFFVGVLLMMIVYCIVLALNGISPAVFFKGYAPAILSGFTLASSSATVPVSLDCCTNNLKIPPMITYFVIPLGSTINMNGSCILLTLICLFTAKVFGITPTVSMMIPVLSMILLLSMAAPGVPGSLIIMLASILPMLGIPSEAAQLSICISPFVGMLLVPVNCTGDAVTAMLIHKSRMKKGS